jgi:hypothetical protein
MLSLYGSKYGFGSKIVNARLPNKKRPHDILPDSREYQTAYRVGKPLSPNTLALLRDGKAIPWETAMRFSRGSLE